MIPPSPTPTIQIVIPISKYSDKITLYCNNVGYRNTIGSVYKLYLDMGNIENDTEYAYGSKTEQLTYNLINTNFSTEAIEEFVKNVTNTDFLFPLLHDMFYGYIKNDFYQYLKYIEPDVFVDFLNYYKISPHDYSFNYKYPILQILVMKLELNHATAMIKMDSFDLETFLNTDYINRNTDLYNFLSHFFPRSALYNYTDYSVIKDLYDNKEEIDVKMVFNGDYYELLNNKFNVIKLVGGTGPTGPEKEPIPSILSGPAYVDMNPNGLPDTNEFNGFSLLIKKAISISQYIIRYISSKDKSFVYRLLEHALYECKTTYFSVLFSNDYLRDHIFRFVATRCVNVNRITSNGSYLIQFVIQKQWFNVAEELLDIGAKIFDEEGELLKGYNNLTIKTFKNNALGGQDDHATHIDKVYKFLMEYYKNNEQYKALVHKAFDRVVVPVEVELAPAPLAPAPLARIKTLLQ